MVSLRILRVDLDGLAIRVRREMVAECGYVGEGALIRPDKPCGPSNRRAVECHWLKNLEKQTRDGQGEG